MRPCEKFWDALGVLDAAAERSHFLWACDCSSYFLHCYSAWWGFEAVMLKLAAIRPARCRGGRGEDGGTHLDRRSSGSQTIHIYLHLHHLLRSVMLLSKENLTAGQYDFIYFIFCDLWCVTPDMYSNLTSHAAPGNHHIWFSFPWRNALHLSCQSFNLRTSW